MRQDPYAAAGVDYDPVDAAKRLAQTESKYTSNGPMRLGASEVVWSRGESAYLLEQKDQFIALVEEGLGTKNIVADAMTVLTGKSWHYGIGVDGLAMIVNDMITVGALPIACAMHLASGSSSWFHNKERYHDIFHGWRNASLEAGCSWGGGETPVLSGLVSPESYVLSGAATGLIKPKSRRMKGDLKEGDRIIIAESSGIHSNGLTLARKIADSLENGFLTKLANGKTYGETLLEPTRLYVRLVEQCFERKVRMRYMVNITGHGWRKFMRLEDPWVYVIEHLPTQLPIFDFVQEKGGLETKDMYATFNMGAGYAFFVDARDVEKITSLSHASNMRVFDAGYVTRGPKQVSVVPNGIVFEAESIKLR